MYGTDSVTDESERTAFRRLEKKYKPYYDQKTKSSKKKKQPRPVDLTEVIDFESILESFNRNGILPPGVLLVEREFDLRFCAWKNALSQWIRESLTSFAEPPNRTNHNAIYGPIQDLFVAANERKILVEEKSLLECLNTDKNSLVNDLAPRWKSSEEPSASSRGNVCKSTSASALLQKLRWSTLGLQFDMSCNDPNCQNSDMLGGHLDDMEADWGKPIISISLGCKVIFLLGGKSREDDAFAMFLRSGDIVLMAGEARECFHGVPWIFTDGENVEITPLELQLSHEKDICFLEYIDINIRQGF